MNKVFIVHGHDNTARLEVQGFLSSLEFQPIVLAESTSRGKTVIEKLESAECLYAVVILSPDDPGKRARQNVIFEWGYFIAMLGRSRVAALRVGDVEIPSDMGGVVLIDYNRDWRFRLSKELQNAQKSSIELDMLQ